MNAETMARPAASWIWRLPVILCLALILRLIWAIVIPVEPVSDAFAYYTFARNIAEQGVYGWEPDSPSAYWAVGTPAVYAMGFWLFGPEPAVVVTLNLLASMVCVWMLYRLGTLYFGRFAGPAAAMLFAFWPITIQFVTILNSELFFMALTLAGLYAWERSKTSTNRFAMLILCAVLFAGASYVRPIALLIPIGLSLIEVVRSDVRLSRALISTLVTLVVMGCMIAPWSLRNHALFGEPVLISTNFGPNFWMGNNPQTNGHYQPLPEDVLNLSETERSDLLKSEALEYIRKEPGAFVTRTLIKAARLHERETIGVVWNLAAIERIAGPTGVLVLKIVSTLYWYTMLAGALGAIVYMAVTIGSGWVFLSTPVAAWVYFVAIHAIIVVGDRYHMPSIPFIALLAGGGLACAFNRNSKISRSGLIESIPCRPGSS